MSVSCSIIIPHFDQEEHLNSCLLAIAEMTEQAEVIVVDNGTPGLDPATYTTRYPQLIWITNTERKNPYTLRNLGIAEANGDHLLFLDAKCQPQQHWLTAMMAAGRQSDIVAGRYELNYHSEALRDMVHGLLYLNNQKNVREGYGVSAGNLLVRKSVFEKIGVFDDAHTSGRDILWSKKALSEGIEITYAHDAVVTYPAHTWEALMTKVEKYGSGAADQGVEKSWKGWMPMRFSTFGEAIKYRGLQELSWFQKSKLFLSAWSVKRRYNGMLK